MDANKLTVLGGVLLIWTASAAAEVQPINLSSGMHNGNGSEPRLAYSAMVAITNQLTRVRIHFSDYHLGARSYARVQSVEDGQEQRLDAAAMRDWSSTSAMFNGSILRVELYIAPGEHGVFFIADRVNGDYAGMPVIDPGWRGLPPGAETLCGTDDRVASTDNRAGRLAGACTGWLVANGAVLTAGHCNIGAGDIFEVNIPASTINGTTVAANAVRDQFPVLANSITTVNNGRGDDWTVCRLGPNTLRQRAHELHGFLRMTRELPAVGQTVRITGCGVDVTPQGNAPFICAAGSPCTHLGPNAQNQTLQTDTGNFSGETGSEPAISLLYAVDTEPANSGSPIIWEANGFAIGIHTFGACTTSGGANGGTSFELNALENAIADVPGANTRYLDLVKAPSGAEDGTVFQPHDTFAEAEVAVPVGGSMCIVRGNYSGFVNRTINKPMTLIAPVGPVTLGP